MSRTISKYLAEVGWLCELHITGKMAVTAGSQTRCQLINISVTKLEVARTLSADIQTTTVDMHSIAKGFGLAHIITIGIICSQEGSDLIDIIELHIILMLIIDIFGTTDRLISAHVRHIIVIICNIMQSANTLTVLCLLDCLIGI